MFNYCKKHYKLNLKKQEYLEREQKNINYEYDHNFTNSKLVEYNHESTIYYKDIYSRLYIIDNNIASCIGHLDIIDDNEDIIFYNIKN